MKKILILLISVLFIPVPATANADTTGNGEYALTKYNIDIVVNENNAFHVTENITAYFNVQRHGIFRTLPLRNEVIRLDGARSFNRAKITDIKVSGDQSTVYNENGNRIIKIGNPDFTLTGGRDYVISYLYSIGKDTGKGYDEFYFNLIGFKWDTTISNIEFTITMPKEFDKSKLGFSSGPQGSVNSGNVTYQVIGNVINGRYNGVLNAGEAITVRLELPDGYFADASNNLDLMMMSAIILPIVFAGLTFLLWFRFGRDEKAVETVEFYPPEGFNSAETGFLYKGKAETVDVVSLLIYLANKGYIKIEETEEKSLFSKHKGFKITKTGEYDGNNLNERLFLTGLFKAKSVHRISSFKEAIALMKNPKAMAEQAAGTATAENHSVTLEDLKNSFYITLNTITASLNGKDNKETIFEKNSLNKNFFVITMIIATFVLVSFKPITESGGFGMLPVALLFPGIGFTVLFGSLIGVIKIPKWFALFWGGMFGGIPWAIMVLPALLTDNIYILTYALGMASIIIMLLFAKYMTKRTAYGNEIMGKIKGFRNFLETAEKPKLEELVVQNPSYFYNILPFTYVLGVSNKWIKKFEGIALQPPNWYSGTSTFNAVAFGSFMSSTMTSASTAMSSSPSSRGGSSGGGSGGGGGGSW
jgi:uncharacterized membrane protein